MVRAAAIWAGFVTLLVVPAWVAATSPLLAWREPVYVAAGFAGVIALMLLLVQPLLARGDLPGVALARGRRVHRWTGAALVAAVLIHVGGLWLTSPPDVIDALTFNSPTPFSVWGVIAMWAIFATAVLALLRRKIGLRLWRRGHRALALIIVAGTVLHAILIEGTMGTFSKAVLCLAVVAVTLPAVITFRGWAAWVRSATTSGSD
ncbi:ferric reductase-like transmembrane domain-containing protein [Jannaschia pohangensis]|uniref:Ferric reductase like transmembrane component n=1 Tax=Jannaschia pohangensis TaxID=390807 RepID=A0A1I3GPU0_9RHOB|nr:ferric reductase-like transmembrane domain-containing protein [Jannaschia pohangensis]SFI25369.1 Ferric reductase like transmembrane component [Jannaschia pohangensis]